MTLSGTTISSIDPAKVIVPPEYIFGLPERVLQFGTGVLLRGLPDYFIDKANRQGIFNGRIVVVKSTETGNIKPFVKQDGLYTICIRDLERKEMIEENIISSSISRVLSANEDWLEVLACARNPQLKIIISNTSGIGIQHVKEDIRKTPPGSFPGKLLAFLLERFKTFGTDKEGDLVIIPTELITNNGKKLKSVVLALAKENRLAEKFIDWVKNNIHFCSSLVDRIVPGKPDNKTLARLQEELGYEDELLIMTEPYRLWVIEGNGVVKKILSFADAEKGVIVTPNINRYRELKLRLLNGTHTLSCGQEHLTGFYTVHEAMDDESFSSYVKNVMLSEIALSIPFDMPKPETLSFGLQVLKHFSKPKPECSDFSELF
jgi:tagaturonate reductase